MPSITFPAIDLSKFDLSKLDLSKFDLSKFDLSKFDLSKLDTGKLDLSKFDLAGVDADKVVSAVRNGLRDSVYVGIGFGVLAVQKMQVRRRELVNTLSTRFGATSGQMEQIVSMVESRLGLLDERFDAIESQLDQVVSSIESRLPEQAGALLGQAHEVAKAARKQVRGLIRTAA